MTSAEFDYLKSAAGKLAYEQYRFFDIPKLELLILKNNNANPEFGALVSLIKTRQAAQGKFSKSEEMFFTPLSLEQSSGETIARHIAKRFKAEWQVADLTCGLGGNSIFLAERVKKVLAVDLDEEKIDCARENALVYGVSAKIDFVVGDAFLNIRSGTDAFFLDPARDREGATKTRSFLNSQPALLEILPELFKITHNVAVKISPAFAYEDLKQLSEEPEVEIISDDNNCKVTMLWFGEFKQAKRRATGFKAEKYFTFKDENVSLAPVSGIKQYLYEVNKAISKAHLIDEVAAKYSLTKININLSWLSSDTLVETEGLNIFRKFKVLHCDSFSLKKFKEFLKNRGISRAEIMTKHFLMTPEEIRKRLKLKDGGPVVLILTVDSNNEKIFILAEKVG